MSEANEPGIRAPADRQLGGDEARPEAITVRLTWIMLFRAVMVAALLLSTLAIRLGTGDDIFGPSSIIVYGSSAATYAVILVGALWLNRVRERAAVWVAHTQLLWDVALATALAVSSGGLESGFTFLYFLNVLVAAGVLGRRGALIVAGESTLLITVLLVAELSGTLVPFGGPASPTLATLITPFLSNVLGMFLIAVLSGYLSEQLRRTSESLSAARETLVRLEELYAAVLRSLPSGVLTVDDDGRVVYVNDAGAAILGASADALIGHPVHEVANRLPIDAPRPGEGGERFEVQLQGTDEQRVIGGSVARLTGVEALAGRVVVFQDLTELRRLQRDVARADRLATLGRFSAGLAHEIRNPLAAMIGCLDLLESDMRLPAHERSTESGRMLAIVQREADRLSNLVSAFLTYARPRPPELEKTSLGQLVADAVEALAQGETDVDLETRLEGDDEVRCDPEQMSQVVWNLVNNAIQATDSREDRPADERRVVRISLSTEGPRALIVIEDNGPGVPPDSRQSIFEPFVTTRPKGTGLGLATCYQIIDAHGGTLNVDESPELGGARFEVRLLRDGAKARTSSPSDPALPLAADKRERGESAQGMVASEV